VAYYEENGEVAGASSLSTLVFDPLSFFFNFFISFFAFFISFFAFFDLSPRLTSHAASAIHHSRHRHIVI